MSIASQEDREVRSGGVGGGVFSRGNEAGHLATRPFSISIPLQPLDCFQNTTDTRLVPQEAAPSLQKTFAIQFVSIKDLCKSRGGEDEEDEEYKRNRDACEIETRKISWKINDRPARSGVKTRI
jgi:hypothetical protein